MSTNPFEIAAAELRLFDVDLPEYYAEIVMQALCPPGEMRVIDRRDEDAPAVQRLEPCSGALLHSQAGERWVTTYRLAADLPVQGEPPEDHRCDECDPPAGEVLRDLLARLDLGRNP